MKRRGYWARTLQQSGDHWHRRGVSVGGSGGESINTGTGGRGSSRFSWAKDVIRLKVGLPKRVGEEEEGGSKEGLEDGLRDTLFDELTELSQHKELQDLEPHRGKTV